MLLLFLYIVLPLFIIYYTLKPLNYWKKKGVKQKSILDCFSNSWLVFFKRKNVGYYVKDLYDEFPNTRYSGTYQFNTPVLMLRDPELIKEITIKAFEHFPNRRTYIPEDSDPLFGRSLFSLKNERWKNMRSTVSPTFTSSKMKGMFHLIKECTEKFNDYFLKKDKDTVSIQLKDASGHFCTDVIASIAFGISIDSLADPNNEFFAMVSQVTNLTRFPKLMKFVGYLMAPKLYKLFGIKFADEDEDRFFRGLVEAAIKEREEKGIIRLDMIHLLLQTRQSSKNDDEKGNNDTGYAILEEEKTEKDKPLAPITNEDITAQCFLFFFAGYESVSTLICCMAHELAVNQDVQNRLREEINETDNHCNGNLTYEALIKMEYMDMVVSEVLRKWPSQAASERICTKPYTIQPTAPEESPLHIEEGNIMVIPIFGIHRDPEYFPDPDRFDPERFSKENKHKIVPYSYVPFGTGPRGCIASRLAILENKVFFYYVLSKFEIVPVEKTCIPLRLTKSPALIAVEDGCWLGLKRI